jgi:prepilin-type N-terminal cleavage/methylation domain-containing protein
MRRMRGFTLVELAVALAVIGLLLGMLVVPLNAQIDQQRVNETQKHLSLIHEALLGFAVAQGRLPCPAVANSNAGIEAKGVPACLPAVTVGAIAVGVVPWATLGLPEADPWGHRFTYVVHGAFADDPTGGLQATLALGDNGSINVTSGGAAPVTIAASMAAVVVSHGKNGLGGFRTDNTPVAGAAGDELENANGNATFVSKIPEPTFDDLVAWVSPNVLKSRMVAANRLP